MAGGSCCCLRSSASCCLWVGSGNRLAISLLDWQSPPRFQGMKSKLITPSFRTLHPASPASLCFLSHPSYLTCRCRTLTTVLPPTYSYRYTLITCAAVLASDGSPRGQTNVYQHWACRSLSRLPKTPGGAYRSLLPKSPRQSQLRALPPTLVRVVRVAASQRRGPGVRRGASGGVARADPTPQHGLCARVRVCVCGGCVVHV